MTPFQLSRHTTILSILGFCAALLLAPNVSAQQTGTITGTVTDVTGAVLPGVTVEVSSTAPNGPFNVVVTDGAGMYTVGALQPGTYDVVFSLPGFSVLMRDGVAINAGATVNLEVELLVGGFVQEVVVVGSRAEPRSVTASAVPVDVISSADFSTQGDPDFTNQLRAVVPSFNVNTQPISDAASVVRPANLRNLAPDHTLVLVNGKRRHRAAVIAWLGNGIADGSQGPDLSVIPSIALRQVEVLRDGASAQYGSDAIAGVMNFQLKDASSGGSMEFRMGRHFDENTGDTNTCGILGTSCNGIGGYGKAYAFSGNVGLPLGQNGFANLSLEYGNAEPTNRAIQRNDVAGLRAAGNTAVRNTAQVWGAPKVEDDLKMFGNFGYLFDNGVQWYAHNNYATKKVTGGFYFRNPNTRGAVFQGLRLHPISRLNVYNDKGKPTNFPNPDELDKANSDHRDAIVYDANGQVASLPGRKGIPSLLIGDVLAANDSGSAHCPEVPIIDNAPDPVAFGQVTADPNCFTFHQPFQGVPDGFPGGFTPQFGGDVEDVSLVTGIRGFMANGLNWDTSVSWGRNKVDTFIFDTVNASLGPDSPTRFSPNLLQQTDVGLNLDLSYAISDMVNVAGGAEGRREQYHLGAGDADSWAIGPYASQGFSSGSNGYNGTRPENSGTWNRSNIAVYGDIELNAPADAWTLGAAVRLEDFEGFGTTMNSKLSGRYALTETFALRAAISSGFRAPTPGQQNAFNVTTEFDFNIGDLVNNGTIPSTSPAAALRGGMPLQPEKSINYSVGSVIDTGEFTFTADYFRIDVSDRLTITKNFKLTEDEVASLIAAGFAEAANLQKFRFFVNDFATKTEGVDFVTTYAPEALGSNTVFSAVFNYTSTNVTAFTPGTIDDDRRSALERGLPETRWNFAVNHTANRWSLLTRLSFYGQYWDREDARTWAAETLDDADMSTLYELYSGKALLDIALGIPMGEFVTVSFGGQNILNTYPDVNPLAAVGTGNNYGQFSPFGFNGAYYYGRVNYTWGGDN